MKHVVSVSLGSSARNKSSEFEMLGERFLLERIGTDGDMKAFKAKFEELDGKVDAMGIGGADLYLVSGERKFAFREIAHCISGVKRTPIVDGSGLKHTLERKSIEFLSESHQIDFAKEKVFLVSAVDRYGMAQALDKVCPDVIYGDLLFGIGLNLPIRTYAGVQRLANVLLPVITKLPFKWFYPTGEKQDQRTPKFQKVWDDRTFICGDSLFILRFAPDRLEWKTILTQSVRAANLEYFKSAGVKQLITTTPVVGNETFATNVMEAAIVALLGKGQTPLLESEYEEVLGRMNWKPNVIQL
ncbi:MAG: quinate 5-dehydrogenase [Armatimonadetes bacterium]|nr:quinate 5-dehydrogenase [Armatimonadota bacterium]